ncbi:hypothetical protein FA95DRAFT_1554998 [Auriscalpium vulgare]|uniref:Uncharacterized protein n=1 Tax=Auriscalpium vulgare TaxID=40419 RepID=A0ACB8S4I6_9AGAM|nr:hypothetical protein FA95DRAFT_1554998 [Auriscalpium vulgare]
MSSAQREHQPLRQDDIENVPVYPIIHMIRSDVTHFIDTSLSYEALTAPDLTYTLVRPLADKYIALQRAGNMSIVFCLLINRVHFVRDQNLTTSGLSRTRAHLCEILAIRTLREYADNMLDLALAATTSWPVLSGADPDVIAQAREDHDDLEERLGNAIEMAIISKAKRFIKSTPCQKVIDAIWSGKCVYQADSSHSFLSDTYKRNPIHFYNPHKAPLLDHYRLKVPAIRSVLEYFNFLVLFIFFVIAIELNEIDRLNTWEVLFMVFALGFSLEKVAALQEHGVKVYVTGTWNGFDLAFVTIYCSYAILRLYGIFHPSAWARTVGVDCLALIACLLFPRLAFVTLKNNLMVLSLRAMIVQFAALMLIAAFCFCGFLYALWTLSRNEAGYSVSQIAWWMLDIWFGLDASGFEKAAGFSPFFGPFLMVTYACLSNTLLLTVLVSILSHTFSTISEDAAAEAMFRRAVSTIEGVKADSLFSYQPPVNLFALWFMLPASYILSPRWFHKVNVFMIRLTNFPILITIAFYERAAKKAGTRGVGETLAAGTERFFDTLPRQFKRLTFFEGLTGGGADIDAIFDLEDELGSALDTEDSGVAPPIGRQRSISVSQQRRASASGFRPTMSRPLPTAQPQPQKDEPANGAQPGPARHRVTSILNRGANEAAQAFSPLAQIFQPLVVDDNVIPEEDHPQTGTRDAVSYGPASRRRLSTMKRPGSDFQQQQQQQQQSPGSPLGLSASPLRKFPTGESPGRRTLAESSDSHSVGEIETLEQTEEKESTLGALQWARKLDGLDKRMRRMEELLSEIAKNLDSR